MYWFETDDFEITETEQPVSESSETFTASDQAELGETEEPAETLDSAPPVEVGTGGEPVLLSSSRSESEVIDYSEQIGYILDCNIAILIGVCFLIVYLIFDRVIRT